MPTSGESLRRARRKKKRPPPGRERHDDDSLAEEEGDPAEDAHVVELKGDIRYSE